MYAFSITPYTSRFAEPPFNSLPDDKSLDWSKLKQIADDILKCIKKKKKSAI